MSCILSRNHAQPHHQLRRRCIGVVITALTASLMWHLGRTAIAEGLARSSLGFGARNRLIATVIEERHPDTPLLEGWQLYHSSAAPGRFVAVAIDIPWAPGGGATTSPSLRPGDLWAVANEEFELLGRVRGQLTFWGGQPGDWDADGHVEVIVPWGVGMAASPSTEPIAWSVVRIGARSNTIAGVVAAQRPSMAKSRLRAFWEEYDGNWSLALAAISVTRAPAGSLTITRDDTLARFRWTKPGGILVLDEQSKPSDQFIHIPTEFFPMKIDPYEDIDAIVTNLLSDHGNGATPNSSSSQREAVGPDGTE